MPVANGGSMAKVKSLNIEKKALFHGYYRCHLFGAIDCGFGIGKIWNERMLGNE